MKIFRVTKDKNYTTINNTIFKDKTISCKTKGFFATIMSLPDDWDFSVNGIKEILLEGKSSVYSFINELESKGYLIKKQIRNFDGKLSSVEYTFFETPINKEIEPHTDLLETVEPLTVNRPQLSTNTINNLNNKTNVIDFDALLVFFNKTTGKNIRLINPKTKAQFLTRLKEGYTKEDIMKAIINCSVDKYHIENPKYLTPEFISRADKIEKYANSTNKQAILPTDWFSRELTKEQISLLTDKQKKSWEHNKSVIAIEGGYLKPIER
jgi:uncharacterized phage protein (TIGR02220 family)